MSISISSDSSDNEVSCSELYDDHPVIEPIHEPMEGPHILSYHFQSCMAAADRWWFLSTYLLFELTSDSQISGGVLSWSDFGIAVDPVISVAEDPATTDLPVIPEKDIVMGSYEVRH